MVYDVIIIGSGPAGLAAAIYAQRAKLSALVIEKEFMSGGQILNTPDVDNYPGLPGIGGFDMGMKFREHAEQLGASFINKEVMRIETEAQAEVNACINADAQVKVDADRKTETQAEVNACINADAQVKAIYTEDDEVYYARTIILAMGAGHRKLGVPGEEALTGMGVSYCATCDGAFFKGRTVAVIGGGDVAVEDALFMARIAEKVYLIHRREELRAAAVLQERLRQCENVEFIWNTEVRGFSGEEQLECLKLYNKKEEQEKVLNVNGAFVAVGTIPNTSLVTEILQTDKNGYIIAKEDCVTSVPGIFAAGDLRTKPLRQVVTAVADGANAVTSVQNYLNQLTIFK